MATDHTVVSTEAVMKRLQLLLTDDLIPGLVLAAVLILGATIR